MYSKILKAIITLSFLTLAPYSSAAYIAMQTPQLELYTEAGFRALPDVISHTYAGPLKRPGEVKSTARAVLVGTTDTEGNDHVVGTISGDTAIPDGQWESAYAFVESVATFWESSFSIWVHSGRSFFMGHGPDFDDAYRSRFAYSSSRLDSVFSVVGGNSGLSWKALAFSAALPDSPISLVDLTEGTVFDYSPEATVSLLEDHTYRLTVDFDFAGVGDYDIYTSFHFADRIAVPEPIALPLAGSFLGLLLLLIRRAKLRQ